MDILKTFKSFRRTHIIEISFRFPAKFLLGEGRIGVDGTKITGTSRTFLIGNLFARRFFQSVDHVQHGITFARAKIIDLNQGE
jgi:hypothetical protein